MASNPYVNKVVYGNSTLIDLSQDTATQADVAQGKYFHLPTGERVQGTASGGGGGTITQDQDGYLVLSPDGGGGGGGGIDIPVFTATYNDNDELLSFVCSMTYAEILAYFDNGNQCSAKFIEFDEDEENPGEYFEYSNACTMDIDDWEAQTPNIICRTVDAYGFPLTEFTYYPNGTLSTPDNVDIYEFPTLTQNGYYYPTQGKVYSGAYVNVPTPQPTLKTKTITANGTYSASSDNADGYSSVTVNVGSGVSGTMTFTNTTSAQVIGWTITKNGYVPITCNANSSITVSDVALKYYDGDYFPVVVIYVTMPGLTNYECAYQPQGSSYSYTMDYFGGTGSGIFAKTTNAGNVTSAQGYAFTVTFRAKT